MSDALKVSLGRLYEPSMWDLRKAITHARKQGQMLILVDLQVPIHSDTVRVALRSSDLYLIGIRNGAGIWYEFKPDTLRSDPRSTAPVSPLLPGSRWIKAGSNNALSSYVALRLGHLIDARNNRFSEMPNRLLAFFSAWDGQINVDYTRLRVCTLTFVICEALRFRSIEAAAANWVSPPSWMPVGHWPVFEITNAMLDRAQNWGDKARSGDPDVQTWLPGMPDLLIS